MRTSQTPLLAPPAAPLVLSPRFSPFRAAPLSPRFSPFRAAPLSPRFSPFRAAPLSPRFSPFRAAPLSPRLSKNQLPLRILLSGLGPAFLRSAARPRELDCH